VSGHRVHIKDSKLLSPAGGGLAHLADMYGLEKIYVSDEDKVNMKGFHDNHEAEFYAYGVRDALVPLMHACSIEDFYHGLGEPGFPTTLSVVGVKYVERT